MPERTKSWSIPGSGGEPIISDTHFPDGDFRDIRGRERGIIIIAHGFKGYKDYGMFPCIATECARAGFLAHRFNFSHSGMTNNIETFERTDLFEKDTWNKQVFDLRNVIERAAAGSLRDPGRAEAASQPLFILGHSRGGVAAILTLGRHANDQSFPKIAGLITLAAPANACSLNKEDQQTLLRDGFLESPSSRTGQTLRIGKAFLQEQLDDPAHHDVLALAANIYCPMLIIHGEDDPTVPASAAHELAEAAGENAQTLIIPGGDHVFNTPNPFPPQPTAEAVGSDPSPQLAAVISAITEFARAHATASVTTDERR